jgi:hypothetical protein
MKILHKFFLVFLASILVTFCFAQPQKQKILLAIFPHPDDESAIGEVLIKYAQLGYKVQLIIATMEKMEHELQKFLPVIH